MRRAASAPVSPLEMGTLVYFFSCEFTYHVLSLIHISEPTRH